MQPHFPGRNASGKGSFPRVAGWYELHLLICYHEQSLLSIRTHPLVFLHSLPLQGETTSILFSPHIALREASLSLKSTENSLEIDNWKYELLKAFSSSLEWVLSLTFLKVDNFLIEKFLPECEINLMTVNLVKFSPTLSLPIASYKHIRLKFKIKIKIKPGHRVRVSACMLECVNCLTLCFFSTVDKHDSSCCDP